MIGLVLLSVSAQAQDFDRLKPLNNKLELKLNYLGKDSSTSKLSLIEKPDSRYSLLLKLSTKSNETAKGHETRYTMHVLVPDSTIQFHILALKPDSMIAFPKPVK